jgi:hypothetical protein
MLPRWFFLFFLPAILFAEVSRVEISTRSDVLQGRSFGECGSYERITGKVYFLVKAHDPHNRRIADINLAENMKDGKVEFASDFVVIRPKQTLKGNGSALLDIPNRGGAHILSLMDGGDWNLATDAGDGWFLQNGYTFIGLGWQWDIASKDALRLYAPIAKDHGETITGLIRGDLMPAQTMSEIPRGHLITGRIGGTEYPVSAPNDVRNVLTVRDSRDGERRVIPRSDWQFAHMVNGKLEASDQFIHLKSKFQPGKIYEYIYVASNPVVAGLAFAAVRDFASYLKHSSDAIAPVQRVYGEGISQDGRFLRDFLYQGFNADEQGRMALDGVLAHVAGAGRGSFNFRFAQPSRDAQPTSSIFFPTDIFPFTDQPERDPITGQQAGLLDRAKAQKVVPKIFFSNTSYEYWGRVASLISISADGSRDVALSPDVRVYHFTGLQHFSVPFPPEKGKSDQLGQQPQSPLPVKFFWRAMLKNMDAWVRTGELPPPSSYPRIDNATLVPLSNYRFPAIPGLHAPHEANRAYRLDFGPGWENGILTWQPPKVGAPFPVLVPQVDDDGNERDGVHLPEISVPLATYTGWNLRDSSIGASGDRVAFEGSFIPFPRTQNEQQRSHDPRKPVSARYQGRNDYLARYSHAIDELVKQRWILPSDRSALLRRGEQEWDTLAKP